MISHPIPATEVSKGGWTGDKSSLRQEVFLGEFRSSRFSTVCSELVLDTLYFFVFFSSFSLLVPISLLLCIMTYIFTMIEMSAGFVHLFDHS